MAVPLASLGDKYDFFWCQRRQGCTSRQYGWSRTGQMDFVQATLVVEHHSFRYGLHSDRCRQGIERMDQMGTSRSALYIVAILYTRESSVTGCIG